MSFITRAVQVAPNSASLGEARKRTFDFFRKACRSIPAVMDIYNLYDVVTISQLRSTISSEIRKNAHITNPKVIDMLLFNGMEELNNVVEHAKQRHHIIGQYVVGKGLVDDRGTGDQDISSFLKNFQDTSYVPIIYHFTKIETTNNDNKHAHYCQNGSPSRSQDQIVPSTCGDGSEGKVPLCALA